MQTKMKASRDAIPSYSQPRESLLLLASLLLNMARACTVAIVGLSMSRSKSALARVMKKSWSGSGSSETFLSVNRAPKEHLTAELDSYNRQSWVLRTLTWHLLAALNSMMISNCFQRRHRIKLVCERP